MRHITVPFVLTAVAAIGIAWVTAHTASAATEEVAAGSNWFCAPEFQNGVCTTTVTAGDTVTWTIVGGIHTVTECDSTHTICPPAGGFDSGLLQPGGTFSQTFAIAGDYTYYCSIHPTEMRGLVSVVAAAADTPAPTPTATPDDTSSPSPTVTPASVPQTGGDPLADGPPFEAILLVWGGALAVIGAGALYAAGKR